MGKKAESTASRIEELFEAAGGVSAYPVINGGTELAPEELSALECGVSTALAIAMELSKGECEGLTSTELAIRMKACAVSMYVEAVVLANGDEEGEDEHGEE